VQITVSTGRPTVPEIAPGTSVAAAEQTIRDAGLTPVKDDAGSGDSDSDSDNGSSDDSSSDDSDDDRGNNDSSGDDSSSAPAGSVLRTEPQGGTELRVGAPVTIVVSNGEEEPDTVKVPSLVGEEFDDARDTLDELGLDAEGRAAVPLFGRDDGRVVDQDPRAGETVERGTTVTLTTV
jgi:beta-lactam-binding protein with PASTA domain